MAKVDKELEQYRNLLKPPATFEDGFGWTTIAGILFCGLIMLPGSIYLGLTLTALPLIIVYFAFSKYIIAGVALGGVKE